MRVRLVYKFVAVLALVSVLPMLLLGWQLITLGQNGVRTALTELHIATADKAAAEIKGFVESSDTALRAAVKALALMDWDNKQVLLTTMLEERRDLKQVSVLSKDGAEVVKILSPYHGGSPDLKKYPKEAGFRAARAGLRHFSVDPASGGAVFYYPFGKDMAFRAVLDFHSFLQSLDFRRIGENGFTALIGPDGAPLAWPEDMTAEQAAAAAAWEISRQAARSLSYDQRSSTFSASLTSMSSAFTSPSGESMLGVYSLNLDLGVAVVVGQPEKEAYSYANFMRSTALLWLVGFLAVATAAGWVLSRSLTRPITALTRAAEGVAAGDFTSKAEVVTSDELRDLADTFNTMTAKLKEYSDLQVDRIIREQKNTEAILFSTEDGILMADMAGKVQVANRKARSVLGIAPEDPVEGRPLEGLIPAEAVREAVLDVLSSRKENYFREIELRSENTERYFKCFSTRIVAPGHDEPIGRLIGFYDITLDKQLAKMKDEFLHSITHDLRNPMGAIKGFVEFMLKEIPGPVNEAQKKMLVSIDRAAFRLLGMINNILDSAKMEAGKMEITLGQVNMREVAARVNSLLEPLGQRKRIRFELEGDPELTVSADASLMERMFTNLIGNAIKFTPEDGAITTGLTIEGENVKCWVRDTGDGIPQEYLGKVFEKFEQVKGQKAGGTGLGLTICKYVATAHLGRIWAESEPGKGAKFLFTFPKDLVKDEAGKVVVRKGG